LFQARFKAILVEKEPHLWELCRYIVLNPVRVKSGTDLAAWKWSSYRATARLVAVPEFLSTG
jgi:putative transposase